MTEFKRFSTFNNSILQFKQWLIDNDCFDVCMESTGKYCLMDRDQALQDREQAFQDRDRALQEKAVSFNLFEIIK